MFLFLYRANSKPRSRSTDNLLMTEAQQHSKTGNSSDESRRQHPQRHHSNHHKTGGKKMIVVSAVDPSGKVASRTNSSAAAFLSSMLSPGGPGGETSVERGSDTLMSFKKTAEIAALFSEVKLEQTTNIVDDESVCCSEESSEDDAYSSMQNLTSGHNSSLFTFSDTNIENSLGYLP